LLLSLSVRCGCWRAGKHGSSFTSRALASNPFRVQPRGARDASVHAGGVNACYLSVAGDLLVTVSKDCTARLWNVVTRQPLAVLRGHGDSVTSAWLKRDGAAVLTASDDGTVRAWTARRGACTLVLQHKHAVAEVAATADMSRAFAACRVKAAWLWDLSTGACVKVLRVRLRTKVLPCGPELHRGKKWALGSAAFVLNAKSCVPCAR
jgi:WD40 repeat protein